MAPTAPNPAFGPLEMLVIQATPFCNLDCAYCYLPSRQVTKKITPDTVDLIFKRVFESGLATGPFLVLWHAGEPLTLPASFYEEAFSHIPKHNHHGVEVRHSFQTNATLVNDEWCDFLKRHKASLGVSIDGPEFLHDRNRRTRSGRGTHARVMEGVRKLQENEVDFGVISVLSRTSLDYADELYDFYCQHGITSVGFNVEEVEGLHEKSSMEGEEVRTRLRAFLDRFYRLVQEGRFKLKVREFDRVAPMLAGITAENFATPPKKIPNSEVKPFMFVNVDHEGRFSTYSPELLGIETKDYGAFYLGNVRDDSFAAVMASEKFRGIREAVDRGVRQCEESCRYFGYCGGGAPVNKYFENGSFDSRETMHCRLSRQVTVDAVFESLSRREKR